jgi:hypothetical protein
MGAKILFLVLVLALNGCTDLLLPRWAESALSVDEVTKLIAESQTNNELNRVLSKVRQLGLIPNFSQAEGTLMVYSAGSIGVLKAQAVAITTQDPNKYVLIGFADSGGKSRPLLGGVLEGTPEDFYVGQQRYTNLLDVPTNTSVINSTLDEVINILCDPKEVAKLETNYRQVKLGEAIYEAAHWAAKGSAAATANGFRSCRNRGACLLQIGKFAGAALATAVTELDLKSARDDSSKAFNLLEKYK